MRGKVDPALAAFRDPARLAFGSWQHALRSDRRARIGTGLLVAFAALAIVGILSPPLFGRPDEMLHAPSAVHPLGTDMHGRDVMMAIVQGTAPTLGTALVAALGSSTIGIALGALGGFLRGTIDLVVHRAIEALTAIPVLLLLLVLQALGPASDAHWLLLVLVLTRWAEVAQVVRADVLRVVQLDHVVAARALGAGPGRILARHVLPSVLASAVVLSAFGVGAVVVLETAVSVVGIGMVHPLAWGSLLGQAREHPDAWWLVAFPSLFVMSVLFATVLLGEAMRDAFDPRIRFGAQPEAPSAREAVREGI